MRYNERREAMQFHATSEKSDSEFSLEHIWPDKLGGALCSSLFKTRDVCKRCNNVAGVFIDGAFIKSAFLALDQGTSPALKSIR